MPYTDILNKNLTNDLLSRKEFYWTKRWEHVRNDKYADIIPKFLLEDAINKSSNLTLHSYQLFIRNYINPHTPYKRLLMKWETGTGKTIGALSVAMNFIDYYRNEKDIGHVEIGSVFIIGFADRVFKSELLRFPEFGFLSREERNKLDKLKRLASSGNQADISKYYDTITKIKKRFSNRKNNGFFKFYGYRAFVNRIFKVSKDINLNDMSEEDIRRALLEGKITYDEELLKQFKNSLIICDEIHTVYNSAEKNNWGIAIQAVLDHEPSCRALFMSATPLNNNATEIIDLLNLLLPKEQRQFKTDYFDSNGKLKTGAIEKIAEYTRGRVSFLRDVNPKYYPSLSTEGESIKSIPYLKFTRCPMSQFHYNTYKQVYHGALSQDSQYLMDFAIENPEAEEKSPILNEEGIDIRKLAIYQTGQIKKLLPDASQRWKDKYGLDYIDERIVGEALKYENLKKYSSKYVKLLDEIFDVIKKKQGKIFIYHNIVHISGVLFIEQVLLKNGFLDEFSAPTDHTICMHCGKTRKEHSKNVSAKPILSKNVQNSKIYSEGNVSKTNSRLIGKGELLESKYKIKETDSFENVLYNIKTPFIGITCTYVGLIIICYNCENHTKLIDLILTKLNSNKIFLILDKKSTDISKEFKKNKFINMDGTSSFYLNCTKDECRNIGEFENDQISIKIYPENSTVYLDNNYLNREVFNQISNELIPLFDNKIIGTNKELKGVSLGLTNLTYETENYNYFASKKDQIDKNKLSLFEEFNTILKDKMNDTLDFEDRLEELNNSKTGKGEDEHTNVDTNVNAIYLHHKGHRLHWLKNKDSSERWFTIHKKKRSYYVPYGSIDENFPIEGLKLLITKLNDRPFEIQIRKNGKLREKLSFLTVEKITKKHLVLKNNSDSINGGLESVCLGKVNGGLSAIPLGKKIKQQISRSLEHLFTPARFIMAHSDIEKPQMEHSIEKFNNAENADGSQFMMLVGSKIIKESYDIKAIQNVFIMSRPDNIPTLIQIRGRAVRKNSHKDLPPNKRQVHFKIFTSCLPTIKNGQYELSYEEEKYRDKVASFQVIQQIEKVLHENAIDSYINYSLITRQPVGEADPLSALPFDLNVDKKFNKELNTDQLNVSTFNIYFAHDEIDIVKSIIKRLFIEKLTVWEYSDLFSAVKNAQDYETEINTKLFTEENYIIALNQLCWNSDPKYTEPLTTIKHTEHDLPHTEHVVAKDSSIIDRLYNSNDKIIALPGGQESIITPIFTGKTQYYILFPFNILTNQPEIDIELPYRVIKQENANVINMNNFIQTKRIDFDYDDKKKIFFRKYVDISIENMENVVCDYGTSFHVKFLDECVDYVFNAWTNPKSEKSELHEFYFKMLYYYDLLSLVMWAYTCKPRLAKDYTKYAIPVKAKDIKLKAMSKYEKRKEELADISPDDSSDLATSGVINLLKSSLNRTSNVWIPAEFREHFSKTLDDSLRLYAGKKKKNKNINKVSGMLLPIGHYISKFPRIYHPEKGWVEDPTYTQSDQDFIENDLLIGYDERSKTGVHIRFKLRSPIHNIKKYKDTRLIEKGTVCKSKSKNYLRTIAKKLDIIVPDKVNVDELCGLIRAKLIRYELKERIKKSKLKYFYFHYESSNPME